MLLPELFGVDFLGFLHHANPVTRPQHPDVPTIYTHHDGAVIPERPDFTLANSHDELDAADQSFTEGGPYIEIWVTDDGEYGISAFIRTANESPNSEEKHILWSAVQKVIASAR